MNETITATYASKNAMKSAVDDLVGVGIPQEKFFVDEGKFQVKVITPTTSKREIEELLTRHTGKIGVA
jgi:hypothetical protein